VTLVLVANNINGLAVSMLLAAGQPQQRGMAYLCETLSTNLLRLELTLHHSDSGGEPSKQPAKEIQMQRIITHFLGDISFETGNLQEIADNLNLNRDRDRDQSDSDSIESHHATPTNEYSIDPLSTSTMRMFTFFYLVYIQLT